MNAYLLGFSSSAGAERIVISYGSSSSEAEEKVRRSHLGVSLTNFRLGWWDMASAASFRFGHPVIGREEGGA